MLRLKSVTFWIFFVLAAGLAVFGYLQLKKSKKPSVDAVSLLPDSCLVYLNSANLHELDNKINQQSMIADRLQLFPDIEGVCAALHALDSTITTNEVLEKEFHSSDIHLALYENKHWLISINIKELGRQEQCLEELRQIVHLLPDQDSFKFNFNSQSFFLQMKDGVLLLSDDSMLIQKALNGKYKFVNSTKYQKFKSALSEDHLLSLFIDQQLFSSTSLTNAINPAIVIRNGFCVGSLNFEPSELKYNGFQSVDSNVFMHAILKQDLANSDELMSGLPYNTAFFEAYACSNLKNLSGILPDNDLNNHLFWNSCSESALYNVKNEFQQNVIGPIVRFETFNGSSIISVAVADTLQADETMRVMLDSTIISDVNQIGRLINHHTDKKLFSPLFASTTNYMARCGDRVYFAEEITELTTLLPALRKQLNMLNNESFSSYRKNNFPDEFSYLLYTSPAGKKQVRNNFIGMQAQQGAEPFENFKHLSYSLLKEKDYFRFRFHVLHESSEKEKNILWSTDLDSTITTTPFPFVNHLNDENEILVQDDANTLYLINAKGNVLWKKKIAEKILSEVLIVDLFRNNKFQILFNTASALHLLDRNGNYVGAYPIKLPAIASGPLSVFDYEGTKDYRLFIPCKNKNIYNYMLTGKKVDGFANVHTDEEVQLALQYVVIGESQYIVALDSEGKIYTFSRKGVGRIGLRNRSIVNCKAFHVDASGSLNSSYIVYLDDKTALICKIAFSDIKSIAKLTEETEIRSIKFCQVDENRSMDLLLTGGNKVRAYDFSGNLISENESDIELDESDYYSDESHAFICAFSKESGRTVVFDILHNNQISIPSTARPLMKDLFKDNKQYLVVPNGKTISCVLLN